MALILRKKPPVNLVVNKDLDNVLAFVEMRGLKGTTARELSWKGHGVKGITWERANIALAKLYKAGKLKHQWSPCSDWKTHYALQEGRYYLATIDIPVIKTLF